MTVIINFKNINNWRIVGNPRDYTLQKKQAKCKTNSDGWKDYGYYGSIEACMKDLVDTDLRTNSKHYTEFKEYLSDLKKLKEEIRYIIVEK